MKNLFRRLFSKAFFKEKIVRFLKYMLSGTIAAFVDYGLFLLLYYVLLTRLAVALNLLIATVVSRVLSSYVNYEINRRFVFKAKTGQKSYLFKYLAVWLGQLGLSYVFTYVFELWGVEPWITKFLTDQVLGFTGYQAQLYWVFKGNGAEGETK